MVNAMLFPGAILPEQGTWSWWRM